MKILVSLLSAALVVQIPADPDGPLEPSVMNEVEHALGRVPECCRTNEPTAFGDIFATNGLSASAIAVSLVSRQDKDGKWMVNGTNATAEAVSILSAFVSPPARRYGIIRAMERRSGDDLEAPK